MKRRMFFRALSITLVVSLANIGLFGCAAGNFGFTRAVAKWNLKKSTLPRVLFYILLVIIPVYPIALVLDLLLNNTIEFWTGTALSTAKNETFEKDGQLVKVEHSADPLRKTRMQAYDASGALVSVVELAETESGAVAVYINGAKRAEVDNINDALIQLTTYKSSSYNPATQKQLDLRYLKGFDGMSLPIIRENLERVRQWLRVHPMEAADTLAANK